MRLRNDVKCASLRPNASNNLIIRSCYQYPIVLSDAVDQPLIDVDWQPGDDDEKNNKETKNDGGTDRGDDPKYIDPVRFDDRLGMRRRLMRRMVDWRESYKVRIRRGCLLLFRPQHTHTHITLRALRSGTLQHHSQHIL